MHADYLQRVLIYLQQELPAYKQSVSLQENKLVFIVPEETPFQPFFEKFSQEITACINRIRNREIDLEFKISSKFQERDFKILK